jgi:hypothetical protein
MKRRYIYRSAVISSAAKIFSVEFTNFLISILDLCSDRYMKMNMRIKDVKNPHVRLVMLI